MKYRLLFASISLLTAGWTATPAYASPASDLHLRFGYLASRAFANFRSAESVESNLRAQGMTLHPQLIALRARIESALGDAQLAMDKGDLELATEALDRATVFVDKYARAFGGA